MADDISQKLHEHGLRSTRPRQSVLRVLMARNEALEQRQISELLEEDMDRATLYRSLRQLEDAGLLHKVSTDDGPPRFAYCGTPCTSVAHNHHHIHFSCHGCGRTFCLENTRIPPIAVPTGYEVVDWQYHLSGLCPQCGSHAQGDEGQ